MNRLNFLFTLTSLSVILVTVERFSFTTKIILPPFDFLRLHEFIQITIVILITTIIPFFLFKEISSSFELLKTKKGLLAGILFIVGIYFYASGNGLHEVSSFMLYQYCNIKNIQGKMCEGLFFNTYYFGNIVYFIGAFLMNLVLMIVEKIKPYKNFAKKDFFILLINSIIYSFAIFAYAAFDKVLVGLTYSLITMITATLFFLPKRRKYVSIPVTTYLLITYSIGTVASILTRFH